MGDLEAFLISGRARRCHHDGMEVATVSIDVDVAGTDTEGLDVMLTFTPS